MTQSTDMLAAFLADRDYPCPGCGYNLRMLQSNRCPECAMEIQLAVHLTEPRQRALITGVVALSAGLGLGGLLLIYLLIVEASGRGGGDWGKFLFINGGGAFVHLLALILWLKSWKKVRRLSTKTRWTLASFCWLLPAAEVTALAMWIK
jgi:hypothetical protein